MKGYTCTLLGLSLGLVLAETAQGPNSVCGNQKEVKLVPHQKCENFYVCFESKQTLIRCPLGLHFNKETQLCDYPHKAGCKIEGFKWSFDELKSRDKQTSLLLALIPSNAIRKKWAPSSGYLELFGSHRTSDSAELPKDSAEQRQFLKDSADPRQLSFVGVKSQNKEAPPTLLASFPSNGIRYVNAAQYGEPIRAAPSMTLAELKLYEMKDKEDSKKQGIKSNEEKLPKDSAEQRQFLKDSAERRPLSFVGGKSRNREAPPTLLASFPSNAIRYVNAAQYGEPIRAAPSMTLAELNLYEMKDKEDSKKQGIKSNEEKLPKDPSEQRQFLKDWVERQQLTKDPSKQGQFLKDWVERQQLSFVGVKSRNKEAPPTLLASFPSNAIKDVNAKQYKEPIRAAPSMTLAELNLYEMKDKEDSKKQGIKSNEEKLPKDPSEQRQFLKDWVKRQQLNKDPSKQGQFLKDWVERQQLPKDPSEQRQYFKYWAKRQQFLKDWVKRQQLSLVGVKSRNKEAPPTLLASFPSNAIRDVNAEQSGEPIRAAPSMTLAELNLYEMKDKEDNKKQGMESNEEKLPQDPSEQGQFLKDRVERQQLPKDPSKQRQYLKDWAERQQLPQDPSEQRQFLKDWVERQQLPKDPSEQRQYLKYWAKRQQFLKDWVKRQQLSLVGVKSRNKEASNEEKLPKDPSEQRQFFKDWVERQQLPKDPSEQGQFLKDWVERQQLSKDPSEQLQFLKDLKDWVERQQLSFVGVKSRNKEAPPTPLASFPSNAIRDVNAAQYGKPIRAAPSMTLAELNLYEMKDKEDSKKQGMESNEEKLPKDPSELRQFFKDWVERQQLPKDPSEQGQFLKDWVERQQLSKDPSEQLQFLKDLKDWVERQQLSFVGVKSRNKEAPPTPLASFPSNAIRDVNAAQYGEPIRAAPSMTLAELNLYEMKDKEDSKKQGMESNEEKLPKDPSEQRQFFKDWVERQQLPKDPSEQGQFLKDWVERQQLSKDPSEQLQFLKDLKDWVERQQLSFVGVKSRNKEAPPTPLASFPSNAIRDVNAAQYGEPIRAAPSMTLAELNLYEMKDKEDSKKQGMENNEEKLPKDSSEQRQFFKDWVERQQLPKDPSEQRQFLKDWVERQQLPKDPSEQRQFLEDWVKRQQLPKDPSEQRQFLKDWVERQQLSFVGIKSGNKEAPPTPLASFPSNAIRDVNAAQYGEPIRAAPSMTLAELNLYEMKDKEDNKKQGMESNEEKLPKDPPEQRQFLKDWVERQQLPKDPSEQRQFLKDWAERQQLPQDPSEQRQFLKDWVERQQLPKDPSEQRQFLKDWVERQQLPKDPSEQRQYLKYWAKRQQFLKDWVKRQQLSLVGVKSRNKEAPPTLLASFLSNAIRDVNAAQYGEPIRAAPSMTLAELNLYEMKNKKDNKKQGMESNEEKLPRDPSEQRQFLKDWVERQQLSLVGVKSRNKEAPPTLLASFPSNAIRDVNAAQYEEPISEAPSMTLAELGVFEMKDKEDNKIKGMEINEVKLPKDSAEQRQFLKDLAEWRQLSFVRMKSQNREASPTPLTSFPANAIRDVNAAEYGEHIKAAPSMTSAELGLFEMKDKKDNIKQGMESNEEKLPKDSAEQRQFLKDSAERRPLSFVGMKSRNKQAPLALLASFPSNAIRDVSAEQYGAPIKAASHMTLAELGLFDMKDKEDKKSQEMESNGFEEQRFWDAAEQEQYLNDVVLMCSPLGCEYTRRD